jgi:titin
LLATHVVSNTLDAGLGSLRQAILDANNDHDATCAITFNIPGPGQHMIQPTSALPVPNRPLTIDGTSQPDYVGSVLIMLDGSRAGDVDGLTITAGHSTIKGLAISHYRNGIVLETNGDNVIVSNFIGTDFSGTVSMPNRQDGIVIMNGSAHNTIGGTVTGTGNIISANGTDNNDLNRSGILLVGAGVTSNQILGNSIGTDSTGLVDLGNGYRGVYVKGGAAGNTIGGTVAGAGNLISANPQAGVQIDGSSGNVVQGNLIGVDMTGGTALPNGQGILINGGSANTIGGAITGAGNVISGNNAGGITILGSAGNVIQANLIGVDQTGSVKLGNGSSTDGIFVYNSPNNLIGGASVGNVIDANRYGIWVGGAQAAGNQIQGNLIGTDASGTVLLGNTNDGVLISAPSNTVGGANAGTGNIISGCGVDGVTIYQTSDALVEGNFIGTDATGTVALPNNAQGVQVDGSTRVQVFDNIISDNNGSGILLANSTHTTVQGNFVGVDASGVSALGNHGNGVVISGGNLNTIGGTDVGAGNVISANAQQGVLLMAGTFGNVIQGNYIGIGVDGGTPLGNGAAGVWIYGNSHDNLIGGVLPGESNAIANTTAGPGVYVAVGPGNSIRQNAIWGNFDLGIRLTGSGIPNIPVLTSMTANDQGVTISGTYAGSPNMAYAIEFFANDQANPSGYGEGQYYLGTMTVVTNNAGNANFTATLNAQVYPGQYISATATTPIGTTSQFALDLVVNGSPNTARRLAAADQAFASLAAALPPSGAGHAVTLLPGRMGQVAPRHDPLQVVWAGADRSSSRLDTGSQTPRTAMAHRVDRSSIDGFFDSWDM